MWKTIYLIMGKYLGDSFLPVISYEDEKEANKNMRELKDMSPDFEYKIEKIDLIFK